MTNELICRLNLWLEMLRKNIYRPIEELSFQYFITDKHMSLETACEQEKKPVRPGDEWGYEWEYGWFFADIKLDHRVKGERVVMNLNLGGEAMLFLDGESYGTRRDDWITREHHFYCDNYITACATGTEDFRLAAECYAGHSRPEELGECASGPFLYGLNRIRPETEKKRRTVGKSTYGIWNEEAYHLYLEAEALYDIWKNTDPASLRACELENALEQFCLILDFEQDTQGMQETIRQAREALRPCLQCKNGSTAPVFHMIGHAHIDLAWLWPLEETERKCGRTMAAQIRHMEEYPEYKMIFSQPYLFSRIEELYPELYEKMLQKIADGQLIPEGGMWVESDTNMPSGESLIRQFYYGKKYFKDKFGIESSLLWLPDVFGYSGSLPQIMKGCGIRNFTTHKIFWTYNGGDPFPYHYFDWKGIDGTKIPSFIHVEYSSPTDADTLIKRWNNRALQRGVKRLLQPVGYGDGGGGASRDHIENCRLFADLEGVPRVIFDHPNHFFEKLKEDGHSWDEYVGELYYQAHRGVYTSQAKTKAGNRRCEMALRECEMWSALANWEYGYAYPAAELQDSWKKVLLNQFHDILPGSSIHKVYERAEREYGEVLKTTGERIQDVTAVMTDREQEESISLFNSLSWQRETVVLLPQGWNGAVDADNRAVPVQECEAGTCAWVTVPACGSISLFNNKETDREKPDRSCHAGRLPLGNVYLENERIKLILDDYGQIISIVEKENGRQWAAGVCNRMCMYQDIPGHFEAWDIDSLYKHKELELKEPAEIRITKAEGFYAEVEIKRRLNQSYMVQRVSLEKGKSLAVFHNRIDWRETHKLLKVEFLASIVTDEIISEVQYGMIKRPNHSSRSYDKDRYEVCNHKWSALTESNRGFAVLNDSKYGISCENNAIRLSLLRASTFPDETADKGIQEFTYGIYLFNTSLPHAEVVQRGYEMNVPLVITQGCSAKRSYLQINNKNMIMDTLKKAEDGTGIILRIYECMGGSGTGEISLGFKAGECWETDMLENKKKKLAMAGNRISLEFGPFEIKTLLITG